MKFLLAVAVLVLSVSTVAAIGGVGLSRMDAQVAKLFEENLATTQATADLAGALDEVNLLALQLIPTIDPGSTARLEAELDHVLIPRVREAIGRLRSLYAGDVPAEERLDQMVRGFEEFLELRGTGAYATTGEAANGAAVNAALAESTSALFARITPLAYELRAAESRLAVSAKRESDHAYGATRRLLAGGVALGLFGGLVVVLLLVRNLVPRIRGYSAFATGIAEGRPPGALEPRGSDELADLGRALNNMVARSAELSSHEEGQAEFADTLQVTATEEEAHELVQRHIERSLPGSEAIVLKRNNSDNRLEAASTVGPRSPVVDRLVAAEPRSCLAVRFGRTHREGSARPPLLSCELCSNPAGSSTCEPLLVGGEVIGSVLVTHDDPFGGDEDARVKRSVAQAAPVLANLRNLALAEFRANNDSLTGLSNKRATEDTLKRMVAQANRSLTPLTAAMLDLDHFKQINDRFGHGKGDEVLAAVGAALRSCLRESDFAGRYGGEEFLILLPGTTIDGAMNVTEKVRTTIASITVAGVEREITASLGVAELLHHGGNATSLVHEADRAVYAAKAAGRNRTVAAATEGRLERSLHEASATAHDAPSSGSRRTSA